ncbi:MAG: helix-turn-helix domain-containing protein [Anaerolineae bacterium]
MTPDKLNSDREIRILEAASKLIAHYGFDKTTVSDIAEEAGISKGAVYLHYKSKEDLFEALIYYEGEKVLDDLLQRIDSDPDSGSIFGLYQHAILASIGNPLVHALMTSDMRIIGDFTRRWSSDGRVERYNLFRTELVEQLQAANVIRRDLNVDIVSYVLALIRYGFLTIHEVIPPEKAPPLEEVGRTLGAILERGLAPEGGGDRQAGKKVLENLLLMMRQMLRQDRGITS